MFLSNKDILIIAVGSEGHCPSTSGQSGICVQKCNGDQECKEQLGENAKCCSNGCGHVCKLV